jgi:hypothetical protein
MSWLNVSSHSYFVSRSFSADSHSLCTDKIAYATCFPLPHLLLHSFLTHSLHQVRRPFTPTSLGRSVRLSIVPPASARPRTSTQSTQSGELEHVAE